MDASIMSRHVSERDTRVPQTNRALLMDKGRHKWEGRQKVKALVSELMKWLINELRTNTNETYICLKRTSVSDCYMRPPQKRSVRTSELECMVRWARKLRHVKISHWYVNTRYNIRYNKFIDINPDFHDNFKRRNEYSYHNINSHIDRMHTLSTQTQVCRPDKY